MEIEGLSFQLLIIVFVYITYSLPEATLDIRHPDSTQLVQLTTIDEMEKEGGEYLSHSFKHTEKS